MNAKAAIAYVPLSEADENGSKQSEDTQLFLLRLWPREELQLGNHQGRQDNVEAIRCHGKVQHVVRGEAHTFSGWEVMIGYLEAMLPCDLAEPAGARAMQPNGQQRAQKAQANRDNTGILC